MMRVALFLMTNLAVITILGVIMAVLGVNQGSMGGMLVMCAVYGFVGSMISLFLSKTMAKRSAGVELITEPQTEEEQWLFRTTQQLSQAAGIDMPEVGIFPANEMNAFATGWNKNSALVAVSRGLLDNMTRKEAEAVIGHEIGHVANGDMVTLSLIQGVMNTFVFFFSMLIANALSRNDNGGRGMLYYPIQMAVQMVLGIGASIIVSWFSRYREFRADEAGANLVDKRSMIDALKRLQGPQVASEMPATMSAFAINGAGLKEMFSTHPPLEKRIAALEAYEVK